MLQSSKGAFQSMGLSSLQSCKGADNISTSENSAAFFPEPLSFPPNRAVFSHIAVPSRRNPPAPVFSGSFALFRPDSPFSDHTSGFICGEEQALAEEALFIIPIIPITPMIPILHRTQEKWAS